MERFLPGPEGLFLFAALVGLPGILARFVVGASWLQVGWAFVVWTIMLALLLGPGSRDETIGWTIIVSMFIGWLGIPIVAWVLKLADLPYRWL